MYNRNAFKRYVKDVLRSAIDHGKNADGTALNKILDDAYEDLKCFLEHD